MKKSILAISLAVAAAFAAAAPPTHREGMILVAPKAGVPEQAFRDTIRSHGASVEKKLDSINVFEIRVPAKAEAAVVQALSKNKHIKFAELDLLVAPGYVANDPYYNNGWHLHKMNVPATWDITEGAGIVVSVGDSGVNPHPDLTANVLFEKSFNTVDNTTDVTDINGHGTMVSGTVAALTNNGIGVSSMMGKAKILPIKISNTADGNAYYSDMAEAITYAANNGSRVHNTSYSGGGASSSIQSAANYMVSKGGVVVWSAGNSGTDPGYYDNPNIILVSATGSNDVRTSWSSFGAYVDVAAPGSGIYTTNRSGGYSSVNGTSFSSPIVAGVVAGMLSVNPSLTMTQVDRILKETAVDLGTAGEDIYYGAGRVNALAAVQRAVIEPGVDTIPPTVSFASPVNGASIQGTVDVNVSAYDNNSVASVVLRVNGVVYATETVAPYVFSLNTTTYNNGTMTLSATAVDQDNNSAVSQINVLVANPDMVAPVLTVSGIVDGGTYRKGNVNIKVTATDTSPVTQSLTLNGSVVATSATNTLSYRWSASKAAKGTYVFVASATDSFGNTSSQTITVYK